MTQRDTPFAEPGERQAIGKRGAARSSAPPGDDNIVDLMRQLASQGSHLAEQQLTLVKSEIRESTTDLKQAIGGLIGAAVVGMAGLGVLLMGFAYLLAQAIEDLGVATLIVGAVTLAIAYVLYSSASKKMTATHFAPERTERTLERTPDIARGELHKDSTR